MLSLTATRVSRMTTTIARKNNRIELTGQWSVDVMRNGNDYYIIDMALAENSALNDCVPSNRLRAYPQQWLPGESNS